MLRNLLEYIMELRKCQEIFEKVGGYVTDRRLSQDGSHKWDERSGMILFLRDAQQDKVKGFCCRCGREVYKNTDLCCRCEMEQEEYE